LVAPDTTIFYKDKKWVPNPYIAEELRRYALGLMAFVEVLKAFPKLSLRGEYDCVQEYSLDGLTLGELETLKLKIGNMKKLKITRGDEGLQVQLVSDKGNEFRGFNIYIYPEEDTVEERVEVIPYRYSSPVRRVLG